MHAWLDVIKYALTAALVAVLGLSGVSIALMARNASLSADNAAYERQAVVLNSQIESARLSADVAHAYRERERTINSAARARLALIENMDLGKCADEKIDDTLADALGSGVLPPAD